jgi:hypothetical protein
VAPLYCFLAALCYVSFRDIFLGIAENRAAEAASAAIVAPLGKSLSSGP